MCISTLYVHVLLQKCMFNAWTLVRVFRNTRTTFGSVKRKHTCFVLLIWASILWPRDAAVVTDVQRASAPAHRDSGSAFILRPSFYYSVTHHLIFHLLFKAYMLLIIYASVALHEHVTNKLKLVWSGGPGTLPSSLPFLVPSYLLYSSFHSFPHFSSSSIYLLSDTGKLCLDVQ